MRRAGVCTGLMISGKISLQFLTIGYINCVLYVEGKGTILAEDIGYTEMSQFGDWGLAGKDGMEVRVLIDSGLFAETDYGIKIDCALRKYQL